MVEQIMFCSHLILTKADRIEKEKLPHIAAQIKPINPFASIHSVSFGMFAIESLLENKTYDFHRVGQLIQEIKPLLES